MNKLATILLASLLVAVPLSGQNSNKDDSMKSCPMHEQQSRQSHHAIVESHGDQAMGFPHDKTTHHFRLAPDGGTIEVTVNEVTDKANTQAIRSHLSHLAVMFSQGDFSTPMFIHDGVPPGVTTMKIMKSTIRYTYEELPSGGRVRIQSGEAVAVAAVHDFLRFQITDHQTHDSLEMAEK